MRLRVTSPESSRGIVSSVQRSASNSRYCGTAVSSSSEKKVATVTSHPESRSSKAPRSCWLTHSVHSSDLHSSALECHLNGRGRQLAAPYRLTIAQSINLETVNRDSRHHRDGSADQSVE